ncbi:MAG: endolytic transglycosylase MltG [Geothermobacteraceae bacterium]
MAALLLLGIGLWFGWQVSRFLFTPIKPTSPVTLTINRGETLPAIADRLEKTGIVTDAFAFRLLARWKGAGGAIKAGEYQFNSAAKPADVLDRLVRGDVRRYRLTIPEGFTLTQIAERFEQAGFGRAEDLLAAARDPALTARYAPGAPSLEGFLFPETYTIDRSTTPRQLVAAMLAMFEKRVPADLLASAQKRGLNRLQLVTLASIVQKEAGITDEMPLIAAVYHNRLRKGMPLQADPTVIYGIPDFDGNLTRKHLRTPTPWNTYTRRGLPPGPICNPGIAAIRAAARPADSDALYFVAKGDGTHAFSRTLAEHNRKVRRFQLKR